MCIAATLAHMWFCLSLLQGSQLFQIKGAWTVITDHDLKQCVEEIIIFVHFPA